MRSLLLFALSLGGCGPDSLGTDASQATTPTLRARTGDTTVWINEKLVRRANDDGGTDLVASGRTSRNLTDGNVFVFDDVYGHFEQVSARRYDLEFSTSELTTLLAGVQTFVRFHFTPSSRRPDVLTGRVIAEPRLVDFTGSGIYLRQPEITGTGIRIEGSSSRGLISVEASIDGAPLAVTLINPNELAVDLSFSEAIDLVGSTGRLELRARTGTGNVTKTARLDLLVASLDLTGGDPYDVWPPPGEAIVDDVAFVAALQRADVRVSAMRSDASALVGTERLEAFLDNTRRTIEYWLEQYFMQRYPTAAERDAALDREIERRIDAAYAFPLDQVDPLDPLPNDPVHARNFAADALLLHLATFNTTASEWGRPLDELTRMFRTRHVGSLRELREMGPIIASTATTDVYSVDWLDALVEVEIERSTGQVVRLLLEID